MQKDIGYLALPDPDKYISFLAGSVLEKKHSSMTDLFAFGLLLQALYAEILYGDGLLVRVLIHLHVAGHKHLNHR